MSCLPIGTGAPRQRSWSRRDTAALAAVTAVALGLRLARLADPHALIFDETYYAKDACWYALANPHVCHVSSEITWVHPPLGKWLIAAGIAVFGFDSFGYRIVPAIAGTVVVALTYLLARRLLRSTAAAVFASVLLALDFMEFVQSRTAMLDIFVPLFGLAALLCALRDRDRIAAAASGSPLPRLATLRPWRLAAGIAAGAAVASKWNGGLLWAAVIALSVGWELAAHRGRRLWREAPSLVAWLVLVPVAVYCLTYVGRLSDLDVAKLCRQYEPGPGCRTVAHESWPLRLAHLQVYMLDFHRGLSSTHPYESPPWSWLLIKRPVSYYFCTGSSCKPPAPDGDYSEVMTVGEPLTWWLSLPALVAVAVAWWRKLMRAPPRPPGTPPRPPCEGTILTGFAFSYLPWLALTGSRQAVFIFYVLPAVPFMYLALAYVARRIGHGLGGRVAGAALVAAAVALFAFYYPLLANVPIPQQQWRQRVALFDHCSRPAEPARTGSGRGTGTSEQNLPPTGWCWI